VNTVKRGKGGKSGKYKISKGLLKDLRKLIGARTQGWLFLTKYKK
jgi:hypothetical protein